MKCILAVEDEQNIRINLQEILEFSDYEVLIAANGEEGLKLALQRQPDLIISDIQMPKMDGYQFLQALRSYPTTHLIPVIFLTGRIDRLDQRRAMELGADDYVTKPFTPEELVSAIEARLSRNDASLQQQREQIEAFCSQLSRTLPHELNTPLNGISSSVDLLLFAYDKLSQKEIFELLAVIQSSSKRLHRLIQNFLLYAELEIKVREQYRRGLAINATEKSLIGLSTNLDVIQRVAETIAIKYERISDLRVNLPILKVQLPETQLRKIFSELIDNAFKFSSRGQLVNLSAHFERNFVQIQLCDRGRGMTAAQLNELGAYVQFERKLYEQQGCGLGLTIARRMIELFGGGVSIYSVPKAGTTVEISIPGVAPPLTA